jgi:hypothetical protein
MGSMRQALAALAIVLCGLSGAATVGYAAYLVSRDSVGLPVTKLDTPPQRLAPVARTTKTPAKPRTVANPPPPPAVSTGESGDDHGGRSGKGSGDSGGGHGGDD